MPRRALGVLSFLLRPQGICASGKISQGEKGRQLAKKNQEGIFNTEADDKAWKNNVGRHLEWERQAEKYVQTWHC